MEQNYSTGEITPMEQQPIEIVNNLIGYWEQQREDVLLSLRVAEAQLTSLYESKQRISQMEAA